MASDVLAAAALVVAHVETVIDITGAAALGEAAYAPLADIFISRNRKGAATL